MLVELSTAGVISLNVLTWGAVQPGMAWLFTRMPDKWFAGDNGTSLPFEWERRGRIYERCLGIKHWKDHLPDAASWFEGGHPKARLAARSSEHLRHFMGETWRGELAHWATFTALPILWLWNPDWAMVLNIAYALASNLPCILVQRYNRARLHSVLTHSSISSPSHIAA